jgi:uncharacterized damage-inducible protein DinB
MRSLRHVTGKTRIIGYMNRAEFIVDQLKRSYSGEAWHGPSLREILADVTVEQASARPIASAHSIWELVEHVRAWNIAAYRRLNGDPAKLSPAEDFPAIVDFGEDGWKNSLAALEAAHNQLSAAIASLPEASLSKAVPGKTSNVEYLLHGIVQHNLYHAGQIMLLKKAATA